MVNVTKMTIQITFKDVIKMFNETMKWIRRFPSANYDGIKNLLWFHHRGLEGGSSNPGGNVPQDEQPNAGEHNH